MLLVTLMLRKLEQQVLLPVLNQEFAHRDC